MTQVSGEDLKRRFGTRAVHAGHIPDPLAGAVMTPIYQTSTYIQEGLGRHKGYEYARTRNPTREVLERNVAALEGDVVSGENVYGGSHRQMTLVWARLGLEFTFVDAAETANIAAAVTPRTKMVYAETPTNPMMRLCDLAAAGEIARRAGANAVGAVPGPFDCWLALRGTKTLALRMRQHDANGRRIAEWLTKHPKVERVYYPGLPSHPQHELACRQMKGFGGMISIELGSLERAKGFAERTRIFALAESLGGVESLVGHPASMTHASVPPEMRRAMGLTDSLVRLSVGIEEVEDLIGDLEQALGVAG